MLREINRKAIEKVQILVAIGPTGTIKSMPQAALELLQNLQSLELIITDSQAKGGLRLRKTR